MGAPVDPLAGLADRPAGAQVLGQFAAQLAAALHVEGAVDRLVRGLHRLIVGEVLARGGGDLLGAELALQPGLRGRPQRLMLELAPLGPSRLGLGGRLGRHRPVLAAAPSRRPRAALLPPDRGPMPAQPPGDLGIGEAGGQAARNLLPLGQRQVPAPRLGEIDRRHPATLAEPPEATVGRHAAPLRRRHRRQPLPDPPPERPPQMLQLRRPCHARTPCSVRALHPPL